MDPATIIAAIGLATSVTSSIMGSSAASEATQRQNEANNRAYAAQVESEGIRKEAMNFDAMRRKREAIREAVAKRSMALTVGTAQGGVHGSELSGAYGGISGRTNVTLTGIEGNRKLGERLFDTNMKISMAQRDAAIAGAEGQQEQNFWSGIGSIGNSLVANSDKIGKIGTYFFSNPVDVGSAIQI